MTSNAIDAWSMIMSTITKPRIQSMDATRRDILLSASWLPVFADEA
jgi:hypothetical protein